jgi:hypothetical protein
MWFYLMAATPFLMVGLGISLAGIVTVMLMSQTKLPARGAI